METKLWINIVKDSEYDKNKTLYHAHIIEQYKLYVEMADRVSSRRNLTNVFFLSLHSTILSVIGFAFQRIELIQPNWLTIFPFTGSILLCCIWWYLLLSYRQLNTAKYKVIGELEKKLPSSPYWSAEWQELEQGKNRKTYKSLASLEKVIPIIFGIYYLMIWFYIVFLM